MSISRIPEVGEDGVAAGFPPKLSVLFKSARYKVIGGGRDAGRSWGAGRALLIKGFEEPLRILCGREIQNTIADSVHRLLCDQIDNLGLGGFYTTTDHSISGKNGTEFIYSGLRNLDASKIKSFEGIDIAWVEEAENLTKKSFNILDPTIRKDNSELWFTLNYQMDTDFIYDHFVAHEAPGAVVVHMTWRDNKWASKVLAAGREHMRVTDPEEYENIWEGKVRTVVSGAIYAKEVRAMIEARRTRPVPYDPALPVHTVWDLGWNDAMAIVLVQRIASAVMVIGYLEASGKTYAECVAELKTLDYVWGTDWLPHDGSHANPESGKNPKQLLEGLGRKSVKIIPKLDVENGIKAVRMMFPRIYIDNTEYENETWEFDGGTRLIECLKRYKRAIPSTTGEPGGPVHDEFSHGADAIRGLATIVDQIRNENDRKRGKPQAPYMPHDSAVGM